MTTCALRDPRRRRTSPSSFHTSSSTCSSSSSTRSSRAHHRDLPTRAARACNAGARSSFRHRASGVTRMGRRRPERFARGNGEDSRVASEGNAPGASLDLRAMRSRVASLPLACPSRTRRKLLKILNPPQQLRVATTRRDRFLCRVLTTHRCVSGSFYPFETGSGSEENTKLISFER